MQKMEEDTAVLAHRARYIEQRYERRRTRVRPDEAQIDEIPAALHARPQGAADIDQMTVRMRGEPPRAHFRKRQRKAFDGVLGRGDLRCRHLCEVLALQYFPVGYGHASVEFDVALFLQFVFEARKLAPA